MEEKHDIKVSSEVGTWVEFDLSSDLALGTIKINWKEITLKIGSKFDANGMLSCSELPHYIPMERYFCLTLGDIEPMRRIIQKFVGIIKNPFVDVFCY